MRRALVDDALATVAPIVADVRSRGDEALLEWTERLDGPRPDSGGGCWTCLTKADALPGEGGVPGGR